MDSATKRILKDLVKKREIPLRTVALMLPKRAGDHRDYYLLASLIRAGYVDTTSYKGWPGMDRLGTTRTK